jgi:hypothetical protein
MAAVVTVQVETLVVVPDGGASFFSRPILHMILGTISGCRVLSLIL